MSAENEASVSQQRILNALQEASKKIEELKLAQSEPIAVIGTACRLPGGANSPEEFWELLRQGYDGMRDIPPDRWNLEEYYDSDHHAPGKIYIRQSGFITHPVDRFDAPFFGITPKEAEKIDPQHRFLLELTWEALEDAGLRADKLKGSQTGVFVGLAAYDYFKNTGYLFDAQKIDAYSGLGVVASFATGRISYFFGFQGPSMHVDTACSSSLTTTHLACQSLRSKECNLAIVGGASLMLNPENTVFMCKVEALSPTSKCHSFDEAADGYSRGEGCGIVVLKRLRDAVAEGDRILALIRGSAINHDGASSGLTVPNKKAQQMLISQALKNAGAEPEEVGYVEAHGTGTPLGDPIEMEAIQKAYCENRSKETPLLVSTAKSNIGHLEAGAGIAGLIKVVQSLHHREVPPHANFKTPTKHIDWEGMPVEIPTSVRPWPKLQSLAGISSFGMNGSNAHVILGLAPESGIEVTQKITLKTHLLTLAAKDSTALKEMAQRYVGYLEKHPEVDLGSLCYTANTGRVPFEERLVLMVASLEELRATLSQFIEGKGSVLQGRAKGRSKLEKQSWSLRDKPSNAQLQSLGERYLEGAAIDWETFYKGLKFPKISLPTYPFQDRRYWVAPTPVQHSVVVNYAQPLVTTAIEQPDFITSSDYSSASTFNFPHQEFAGVSQSPTVGMVNPCAPVPNFALDRLFTLQLETWKHQQQGLASLMSQQMEMLRGNAPASLFPHSSPVAPSFEVPANKPLVEKPTVEVPDVETPKPTTNIRSLQLKKEAQSPQQQAFIQQFIERYNNKTQGSKAYAQKHRAVLSDWINSLSLRLTLKELTYPLVAKRSEGARFWDLDGNEYLDIAVGFGVHFFGHNPDFIRDAIIEQLQTGYALGMQADYAGEVAELIHEITGVERVTFCNTGSEAVMMAVRVARTVTKRRKIVFFTGSYHGTMDLILAFATGKDGKAAPVSPGLMPELEKHVLVLEYGDPKSLDIIREHAADIAAVLVEPVQSRNPALQPLSFLQGLRQLTLEKEIALIFDEMITGFRIQPGGAQAHFGIKADLVTYGKIVGGGMPIGILAGKSKFMDAIDGGMWQFGDDSHPKAQVTVFAGTFCRHPLTLATSRAALLHIKEQGSTLQDEANRKGNHLAATLNQFFNEEQFPIRCENFGSLFYFKDLEQTHPNLKNLRMDLFLFLLRYHGVYMWERAICFISTAHTDQDVEQIIHAIKETMLELKKASFFS
ncbi:aminotransferase class III-fold pyridoxal phosphate-dependent enzyme [Deltaproteobacteria bacterium TL4]